MKIILGIVIWAMSLFFINYFDENALSSTIGKTVSASASLFVVFVFLYLINLIRAPILIDKEQNVKIAELEEKLKKSELLKSTIDLLKKSYKDGYNLLSSQGFSGNQDDEWTKSVENILPSQYKNTFWLTCNEKDIYHQISSQEKLNKKVQKVAEIINDLDKELIVL